MRRVLSSAGELPPLLGGGTWLFRAGASSVWSPRRMISESHFRHFMRKVLPAILSSEIWYFALQVVQRNFIQCFVVSEVAKVHANRARNDALRRYTP